MYTGCPNGKDQPPRDLRVSRSFPFLTFAYMSRAVIFRHIFATWDLSFISIYAWLVNEQHQKHKLSMEGFD